MNKEIKDFLKSLRLGQEIRYKNMIIFPISSKYIGKQSFLTIDEALKKLYINITETSEIGDVPNLMLSNLSKNKIFILDGEELIGAKQNRVTNAVVLVPEEGELVIPVSCVERNRWNYKTKRFYSGNTRVYFRLRKKIFELIVNNSKRKLKYHPQHDIWRDIDIKISNMKVKSSTNAMNDIYKKYLKQLELYSKRLKKRDDQIGMLVIINNKVICCELFSNPDMMSNLYEKILNSYVIDAIEEYSGKNRLLKTIRRKALKFLNDIKKSNFEESNSIGLGKDLVFNSDTVYGSALNYNNEVVYMSIYNKKTIH